METKPSFEKVIVDVSYPDNKGNHTTNLNAVIKKFHLEDEVWKNWFFTDLTQNGIAHTRFGGEYTLNLEEFNKHK